jgi:uncharacterized membrane protein
MSMGRFEERLARELRAWTSDGLITEEQAQAIGARYAERAVEERRGRLVSVVAIVGAVVVGLGVILFFAANWSAIPHLVRLAMLVTLVVGAYAGGDALRATRPRVAHALVVLGVLLFGTSIFLVGQMENVSTHDPLAFLLWAGAAAAMGTLWRSMPLATLAILLFAAWQGHELFFGLPDSVAGASTAPLAALYGAALYAVGAGFAPRLAPLGFTAPMRALGVLFASVPLFAYSFGGVAHEIRDENPLGHGRTVVLAFLLCAAAIVGVAALARTRPREGMGIAAVGALGLLPAVLDVPSGLYVVAFGLLALGLIVAGVESEEEWLVNVGVLFIGVELLARFFDLFGRMLSRSGAFVVTGLLLLGLAWTLERGRARLVGRIRA